MGIIAWIIFGAIAGWLTSLLMGTNKSQGLVEDIVLGVIGAFVGGLIMSLFGRTGVTGFNIYSFAVAVIGAAVVVWAKRKIA